MISAIFHEGSGIGNQLHRYVAARVLAEDKGYNFGMVNPELFKGASFMSLDMGKPNTATDVWTEKIVRDNTGTDIRGYDPEINFVQDNTVIEGEFQDYRYFGHRLRDIDTWLAVEPLYVPDDLCVIGFRGGEYSLFPDLFLTQEYWDEAVFRMRKLNPAMRFEVHTDDPSTASKFFTFPIIENKQISHSNHSNMGYNWRAMRYARHAIISNSSFGILPRLLSGGITIAPRYWARRNTKTWCLPQNYYSQFLYV